MAKFEVSLGDQILFSGGGDDENYTLKSDFEDHVNNTGKHPTHAKQTYWDQKLDEIDLFVRDGGLKTCKPHMANNGAEVSDIVAHWIGIGQKDIQVDGTDKGTAWELTQVQIKCASELSEGVGEKAFYLGIWEAENAAEGPYSRIAVSTNAVQQKAGQLSIWKFEKTVIHHRNIRLAFIETQDGIWPSENWHLIGVRQADRTNDTGNYTGVQNVSGQFDKTHVPLVTLQYANLKSKTSSEQLTEAEVVKVKSIIKTPLVIGEGEAIYGSGGEGTHKSQRDVWLLESGTTISNPEIYSGLGPFVIGGADVQLTGQFETFITGQNSTINTGNYNGVDGFGLIGSGSLIVNSVKGFVATGANTTMTVGNGGISGIVCISNRDPSQNPNEFALNLSNNSNDTYARPNGVIIGGENTRVHASDNLENKGVFILGENGSVNADNIMPTNSGVSILGNQTSNIGSYGYNNGVIIVGGGKDILNVEGILQNNGIVIYGKTTAGSSYIHFGTDSNTIFYGNIVDKNGTKILDNGVFQEGSSIDLPAGNNFTQPVIGERAKATANTSVAIGTNAQATAAESLSIGNGSLTSEINNIAIGYQAKATGIQSTAIGYKAVAPSQCSTVIASDTSNLYNIAPGSFSITIGPETLASAFCSIAIGYSAGAFQSSSIAIGEESEADGDRSIAIGPYSKTSEQQSIAIGYNTKATGKNNIAFGVYAKASGENGIAIGEYAVTVGNSIAIGADTYTPEEGVVVLKTKKGTTNVALYLFAPGTTAAQETGRDGLGCLGVAVWEDGQEEAQCSIISIQELWTALSPVYCTIRVTPPEE